MPLRTVLFRTVPSDSAPEGHTGGAWEPVSARFFLASTSVGPDLSPARISISLSSLGGHGARLDPKAEPKTEPTTEAQLRPLDEVTVAYCRQALALCGGNRGLPAEKLGISRHTLARKVGDADEP